VASLQFLFDLDGTLTREELLPKIAREVGLAYSVGTPKGSYDAA